MTNKKTTNRQNSHVVIEGELTIYTVLEWKDKLMTDLPSSEELELDLSGVGEFDAAGLQLLVMIKQEATTSGKVLKITGHSPAVVDLLDLSGLVGFFGDPLWIVRKPTDEGKSI
ncbi:MAG: STAS domain-containing protein [Gammaproteobacteria bacterium]